MVSRVLALIAVALAAATRAAFPDDLANAAFRRHYGKTGVTSLTRTADVADTDYIAANAVADDLSPIEFIVENRTGGAHTTGLSVEGLSGSYRVFVDG